MSDTLRFRAQDLENYIVRFLTAYEVPEDEARITAEVLTMADLRGIHTHGITQLHVYYGDRLRKGIIKPKCSYEVAAETQNTLSLDAKDGLGQPAGVYAMRRCIEKAEENSVGIATVRNSNHFGFAGYYAMLALEQEMIGISLTNSQPLVTPTYGKECILGTNPISLAVPVEKKRPYVLDMATSIASMGKVRIAEIKGERVPEGYGVDAEGEISTDPSVIINKGGLLPLGGTAEMSGYKGYGLAVLVDILSGVLSGGSYATKIGRRISPVLSKISVGHFFMALNIEAFRPLFDFKRDMDELIDLLVESPKVAGEERIFIHGEKEFEREEEYRRDGIPLPVEVVDNLKAKGEESEVPFDLASL